MAGTRAKKALVIYESTRSYEAQVLNDFMNLGAKFGIVRRGQDPTVNPRDFV